MVFADSELEEEAVIFRNFRITAADGKSLRQLSVNPGQFKGDQQQDGCHVYRLSIILLAI
jgi:hypothetical protein